MYVHINHFAVHLKLTQHFKLTILQFKKMVKKKNYGNLGKKILDE